MRKFLKNIEIGMQIIMIFIMIIFNLSDIYGADSDSIMTETKNNFAHSGNAGISLESYNMILNDVYAITNTYLQQYQNPLILNTFVNSSLKYQKDLSIDSRIYYRRNFSGNQLYTVGYLPENPSFLDEVRLPYNVFNVTLNYKRSNLSFGSQMPVYSDLTLGGVNLFGLGGVFHTKWIRLSGIYGTSQLGIDSYNYLLGSDTVNVPGAYERKIFGLKLGLGNFEKFTIDLNYLKSNDALESASTDSTIKPQEGMNFSIGSRINFSRKVNMSVEMAGSMFTSDYTAEYLLDSNSSSSITRDFYKWYLDQGGIVKSIFDFTDGLMSHGIRSTTNLSYAANADFNFNERLWSLKFNSQLIGPGYKTPGFYYAYLNDFWNNSISFRISNMSRNLNVATRLGFRINNFSEVAGLRTNSFFGHILSYYRFNNDLKLDFSVMHYNIFSEKTNFQLAGINQEIALRLINLNSTSFKLSPTILFKIADREIMSQHNLQYEFYSNQSSQGIQGGNPLTERYYFNTFYSTDFANDLNLRTSLGLDLNPEYHNLYRFSLGGNYPFYSIRTKLNVDFTWNITDYKDFDMVHNLMINPYITYDLNDKTFLSLRAIIRFGEDLIRNNYDFLKGNYFENSFFFNINRRF